MFIKSPLVVLGKSTTNGINVFTSQLPQHPCCNPSFGLATKAKGLQGCRLRGNPGIKAKGSPQVKATRSPRVTSHTPESVRSVREYERVNPHTPKATPTLGNGVPMDSRNFKEQFQGSKPNGL